MADRYIEVVEPEDNVATVLREVDAGETVVVAVGDDEVELTITEDIEFGHKFALTALNEGDRIVKYGKSIGNASTDIDAGDWVHVHNVDSNYGRGDLTDDPESQAIQE